MMIETYCQVMNLLFYIYFSVGIFVFFSSIYFLCSTRGVLSAIVGGNICLLTIMLGMHMYVQRVLACFSF